MTVEERLSKLEHDVGNMESIIINIDPIVTALVQKNLPLCAKDVFVIGFKGVAIDLITLPYTLLKALASGCKDLVTKKPEQPAPADPTPVAG